MKKVRNKSDTEQTFTNLPPFAVGESRDLTEEEYRIVENSPHMELVKPAHSNSGVGKNKPFRGVDKD